MTAHAFPALGFDPAPGQPDALEALGQDCLSFGAALVDDADRVRSLADGQLWKGRAAEAFRRRLDDLPRDLDQAGDAYREAYQALAVFSGSLAQSQVRARALEQQAATELASRPAAKATDDDTGSTNAELDRLRSAARRLHAEVRADAEACSRALDHATRHAPHPPGWFHRLVDMGAAVLHAVNKTVGDFVRKHAAAIATFAAVMSKVSSVLALVAMIAAPIPILGEAIGGLAGTGALIASGLALAGHAALAVYAGGGWGDVGLDALGVVSGLGPRVVGRIAKGVTAGREAGEGVEAGLKTRQAITVLRNPSKAIKDAGVPTMNFPTLVTRTISYHFDMGGGVVGIIDLADSSEMIKKIHEAGEKGRLAQERLDHAIESEREQPKLVACP